jgi:class 3 adenylate cyclase
MTPEGNREFWKAVESIDVRPLLGRITVPTLVMYTKRLSGIMPLEWSREIASRVPGARFVQTRWEESSIFGWGDESTRVLEEFLGVGTGTIPVETPTLPSGTAIILFADIADSTPLTERLGDAAFRGKARELDTSLRAVIREHAGTTIEGKLLGDGVLAVFTSARQAIEAALACANAGDSAGLPLHLGLHAGDVIREGNNVYGGAVNVASRISGLSPPGEVLVSDIVRGLARTSAGVRFEDRGEQSLKGVGEPVRVWAVESSANRSDDI